MVLQRLSDIKLETARPVGSALYPSPLAWEDQVFYFLMVDRFSDGQERGYRDNSGAWVETGTTPLFQEEDRWNATAQPEAAQRWRQAGGRHVGGNLRGLTSKLGYLKRLGVTALWLSPVFKQVPIEQSYHGYGIQNFLDVDPHFGTMEDLRELVRIAHSHGIYVLLDIILNHVGNVFAYQPDRYWNDDAGYFKSKWDGNPYEVAGFRDASGNPTVPFTRTDPLSDPTSWPETNAAIWPVEFQDPACYTKKGHIVSWDSYPEYLEGDVADLKDVYHGQGSLEDYVPSPALLNLCKIYRFWMAYADLDGYRVDAVKHMDPGATRFFASSIHEYAQSLGKENFYLIGEIAGSRTLAFDTLEQTGLDAALGIEDVQDGLEYVAKGQRNPADYFSLFRNSLLVNKESHVWFRNKVITMFDDHDQVRKSQNKARFCADPGAAGLIFNALALNVMTLGIPCVYYGSEQCFDGHGGSDHYLREAIFGGAFGAFGTEGVHFFNEEHPVYSQLSDILAIRRQKMTLRRGRQYLRPICIDPAVQPFAFPSLEDEQLRTIVAWSRIFNEHEIVLAINSDPQRSRTVWITIDNTLYSTGALFRCLYSTEPTQNGEVTSVMALNGSAISFTIPAAGFVMYEPA
jgi:glycosidase